jgi:hypothetical protein
MDVVAVKCAIFEEKLTNSGMEMTNEKKKLQMIELVRRRREGWLPEPGKQANIDVKGG